MKETKVEFDIQKYLRIAVRRKWFFIIPLIVISLASLAASFLMSKVYEAKAVILIEDKRVLNPLLNQLAVSRTVQDRLNALREDILAWPRIFQLVEKLGLNKDVKDPLEVEELITGIRKNITLNMRARDVVNISYRGKDPWSTQELVNTLCDILIERNVSSQSEDTASAIQFINEQLTIYKDKLNSSESELRKFKEIYGLGTLPGFEDASPTGYTLAQINRELSDLEAELVLTSIDCTEEHPRVKEIRTRIETLKEKRDSYVKEVAEDAGIDAESYINIVGSLPRQEEELTRLNRDKAINERIHAMLLERLETAKITESLDVSDNRTKFRIIEPARFPLVPIKPSKLKVNFLGLILGCMCGGGLVYVLEYTDSSFKSEDDLKEAFDHPVLGSISKIVTEEDVKRKQKLRNKIIFSVTFVLGLVIAGFIAFSNREYLLPLLEKAYLRFKTLLEEIWKNQMSLLGEAYSRFKTLLEEIWKNHNNKTATFFFSSCAIVRGHPSLVIARSPSSLVIARSPSSLAIARSSSSLVIARSVSDEAISNKEITTVEEAENPERRQ